MATQLVVRILARPRTGLTIATSIDDDINLH